MLDRQIIFLVDAIFNIREKAMSLKHHEKLCSSGKTFVMIKFYNIEELDFDDLLLYRRGFYFAKVANEAYWNRQKEEMSISSIIKSNLVLGDARPEM